MEKSMSTQDMGDKLHAALARLVSKIVAHAGRDRAVKILRHAADLLEMVEGKAQ